MLVNVDFFQDDFRLSFNGSNIEILIERNRL